MDYRMDDGGCETVSEMAIVDTFTKLIFGEETELSARELSIVRAFRDVDENVLMDSHAHMGDYLRNLGVREMIHLVARIREQLNAEAHTAMGESSESDEPGRRATRRSH